MTLDRSTAGLREAFHANNTLAGRRVASISRGGEQAVEGPWDLVATGVPGFPGANTASVIGRAGVDDLEVAIDWFRSRGVPGRFLLRDDEDAHLAAALEARGAPLLFTEPVLALPEDRAPPAPPTAVASPLVVTEVTSDADLERYGPVNWPPEEHYIGRGIARQARDLGFVLHLGTLEGAPIACSMTVVTGDLVAAYNVGVEPPYRRRGFGEAMTWAAFRAGLERGGRHCWLGASEMGYPLYLNMGFVPQFEYRALGLPPG